MTINPTTSLLARIRNLLPTNRRERGDGLIATIAGMFLLLVVVTMAANASITILDAQGKTARGSAMLDVKKATVDLSYYLMSVTYGHTPGKTPEQVQLQLPTADNEVDLGVITAFDSQGLPVFDDAAVPTWSNYAIRGTQPNTNGTYEYVYDRVTNAYYERP